MTVQSVKIRNAIMEYDRELHGGVHITDISG